MKQWQGLLACLVVAACGADKNDDYSGTRAECAEGGALEACPEAERTPEGACWRLVDCAVIPLRAGQGFDWGRCVDDLESEQDDSQRAVIDCIAASSCDALKVDGSPDQPNPGELACFQLGGPQ